MIPYFPYKIQAWTLWMFVHSCFISYFYFLCMRFHRRSTNQALSLPWWTTKLPDAEIGPRFTFSIFSKKKIWEASYQILFCLFVCLFERILGCPLHKTGVTPKRISAVSSSHRFDTCRVWGELTQYNSNPLLQRAEDDLYTLHSLTGSGNIFKCKKTVMQWIMVLYMS